MGNGVRRPTERKPQSQSSPPTNAATDLTNKQKTAYSFRGVSVNGTPCKYFFSTLAIESVYRYWTYYMHIPLFLKRLYETRCTNGTTRLAARLGWLGPTDTPTKRHTHSLTRSLTGGGWFIDGLRRPQYSGSISQSADITWTALAVETKDGHWWILDGVLDSVSALINLQVKMIWNQGFPVYWNDHQWISIKIFLFHISNVTADRYLTGHRTTKCSKST